MTRTVLVTGSEGFLGRALVAALESDDDIRLLRAVRSGHQDVGAGRVVLDVGEGWPPSLDEIDEVVHLAWWGLEDFRAESHLEQAVMHIRFLDGALAHGVRSIVAIGTCLEYGLVEGELSEELAPRPVVNYARAKATVAQNLLEQAERLGATALWARVFYPFGPGQTQRSLWSSVMRAIAEGRGSIDMSPGDQERDFLPVADVGRQLRALLRRPREGSGPVNICSGTPTSVRDIAARWITEAGAQMRMNLGVLPYPDYEPHRFWGSRDRFRRLTESSPGRSGS